LYAGLLGVMLGALGAHRWYLGYRRAAVVQLVLTICTGGVAGIWGAAEGWLILAGAFGRDAQGHQLTHHSTVHLITAALGSLALHAGTTLGAVWLAGYSSPALIPPPSGVNSIALSPATPAESAAPPELEFTVAVDTASQLPIEAAKPMPMQWEGAPLVSDPRDPAQVQREPTPAPVPLIAPPAESTQLARAAPQLEAQLEPALPAESARPAVERTPASAAPSTSVAAEVSAPSPASIASRESRGFDTDSLPSRLEFPQPVYPPELRQRGIAGLVKLRVRVGADGRVKGASVHQTSGYAAFDRAALAVIGRWRFEPARRAGFAVEMEIAVPIRFVIADATGGTP
jgi:protein TonB